MSLLSETMPLLYHNEACKKLWQHMIATYRYLTKMY